MKKFAWKKCRKMFLEALFSHSRNFQSFCTKFWSLPIIGLQLSQCLSANHNLELRCVICTAVTLFAPVLHLNCTGLSQSESSNFFICLITNVIQHFSYYITNLQKTDVVLSTECLNKLDVHCLITVISQHTEMCLASVEKGYQSLFRK